jgi:hypothetical protein
MLEQRAGEGTKVIQGTAETVALPAPDVVPDGLKQGHARGGHRGRGEKTQLTLPDIRGDGTGRLGRLDSEQFRPAPRTGRPSDGMVETVSEGVSP